MRYWVKLAISTLLLVVSLVVGLGTNWYAFLLGAGSVIWTVTVIANVMNILDARSLAQAKAALAMSHTPPESSDADR